jgi:hypothetical protein
VKLSGEAGRTFNDPAMLFGEAERRSGEKKRRGHFGVWEVFGEAERKTGPDM